MLCNDLIAQQQRTPHSAKQTSRNTGLNEKDPAPTSPNHSLRIAGWDVYISRNLITKGEQSVRLEPRTMAVLACLAEEPGVVVKRQDLEDRIWPGGVVGYDALSNVIARLRKAFGDDPKKPVVIQTIPKVGYQLIAVITRISPEGETGRSAQPLERKLAAILYADVAEYSRLTEADEEGTHHVLSGHLDSITNAIAHHNGKVVHYAGDAVLAEFSTVVEAVTCSVDVQRDLAARNAHQPAERKLQFRIGINLGDVIVDRDDIFGEGVNVAARLESLADPGGICISEAVRGAIGSKLSLGFEFLGEQSVKNIAAPVRAYRVLPDARSRPKRPINVPREPTALVIAALLVLIGGGLLVWLQPWSTQDEPAPVTRMVFPLPDQPSIAVLPFTNMSSDAEQDHFADGMTDDLITDLSKISGLFVIARHTSFSYKGKPVRVSQVAEELGVRFVLEGSVRRAGGEVRINAQLIDAATDRHLWAERYDGEAADIFSLQDQVINRITAALEVTLTDAEKSLVARIPTRNLEAYDYFQRAKRIGNLWGSENKQLALSYYQKAIELDPEFADAYAGIARTAREILQWGMVILPAPAARKLAYAAASKALTLDPNNAQAYSVLARLQLIEGEHELAITSAQKAVSLQPNDPDIISALAAVLAYAGEHAEALAVMTTALRLEPSPPPLFHGVLGFVLFWNRQYPEAIDHLEKALDGGVQYYSILAMTYAQLGRAAEARAMVEKIVASNPSASLAFVRVAYAQYKRADDLELQVELLRKAGIPQWPYGFQGRAENRLSGAEIAAIAFGRSWIGHDVNALGSFAQEIDEEGNVAFRGSDSLLTGSARVEGDRLCLRFPALAGGQELCNYLFRNPEGNPAQQNKYALVGPQGIFNFTIEP